MSATDRIRLEGSGQRARVIEIDYSTNTITVDSDLSWSKNTGVALAYAGAAPDQGAHERGLEPDPVTWGRVREPAAVKSHGACLILSGRDVACRRRRVVEGRMFDIRGQRIRAGSIMADGIVVVRMRSGLHPGR